MDSGIESGRKYYKFCPYARFDTESMERWLNERADEGYVLSRRGFIGPYIVAPLVYFIFYIAINNAFGDAGSSPVKNSALILALVLVATLYFPVGVSAVLRQRLNKLRRERGVQLSDVEYKRRAVGRTLMWILIPVLAVAELIVGFQIINNLG